MVDGQTRNQVKKLILIYVQALRTPGARKDGIVKYVLDYKQVMEEWPTLTAADVEEILAEMVVTDQTLKREDNNYSLSAEKPQD